MPVIAAVKTTLQRWFGARGAADVKTDAPGERQARVRKPDGDLDDWEGWQNVDQSTASLMGTDQRQLRARAMIYRCYQDMASDPVISSALRLHVTSALGGHESRGEMVFIEPAPSVKGDKKMEAMVASIATDLQDLFNRIAPQIALNGVLFGDGYGRVYSEPGAGVRDVYVDELVLPPLIQPYERANTTVGYVVSGGPQQFERLSVLQMARMRMPRLFYVPQDRISWRLWRTALKTDRVEELPVLPALAGGSFLDGSEKAYQKFAASWAGLTGQRVRDSIRQTFITVNQESMSKKQRSLLSASLARALTATNTYITSMVEANTVPLTELFHFLPVFGEKQMVQLNERASSAASGANLTIDDVMMNARFLAGALGLDLSMLGFSDQLSGGLGDGGFFRTSAQSAERARMVRTSLAEALNHIIAIHVLQKHGLDFGNSRPWQVQFFGGISAFETEKARTQADKMNASAVAVQTFAQMKELGMDAEAMETLMTTMMGLDAAEAKLYAKALEKAAKEAAKLQAQQAGGDGGPFGGNIGGGGDEGEPLNDGQPAGGADDAIEPVEG